MAPAGHLGCGGCRIRVRAGAPEIDLLEGSCPICGEPLTEAVAASAVLGFRSFGLDALSEQTPAERPDAPAHTIDLATRRSAAVAHEGSDARRWTDEGGSLAREAAGELPAGS